MADFNEDKYQDEIRDSIGRLHKSEVLDFIDQKIQTAKDFITQIQKYREERGGDASNDFFLGRMMPDGTWWAGYGTMYPDLFEPTKINILERERAKFLDDNPEIKRDFQVDAKGYTTAKQVLAIYYLLEKAGLQGQTDLKAAEFIQFLTGKELNTLPKDTAILKRWRTAKASREKLKADDVDFVIEQFRLIGLESIVSGLEKRKEMPNDSSKGKE